MLDVLEVTDENVRATASDVAAAWVALEAASTARRVATPQDAEALRRCAQTWLGRARGQKRGDKTQSRRALPMLVLARLVDYRLSHPQAPLGAGAVLRVWWGSVVGRF
jgi:hypothetical protein